MTAKWIVGLDGQEWEITGESWTRGEVLEFHATEDRDGQQMVGRIAVFTRWDYFYEVGYVNKRGIDGEKTEGSDPGA